MTGASSRDRGGDGMSRWPTPVPPWHRRAAQRPGRRAGGRAPGHRRQRPGARGSTSPTRRRAPTPSRGPREELGGLDVLVNNAGVMLLGAIVGADTEDWRRMIHTNVLGPDVHDPRGASRHGREGRRHRQHLRVAGGTARTGAGATRPASGRWTPSASRCARRSPAAGCGSVIEPGAVATELRDHITQPEAKAARRRWRRT